MCPRPDQAFLQRLIDYDSAIPVPRGSTHDHPLAPAEGKAPKPDYTNLGHCRADHPEHLDRDRAIGIDEVRAVEIDRIDVAVKRAQ